jgi:S-formylglutathione hydrolase
MGGHGALTLHLKNPNIFKTCSAFSPIVTPSLVPWGQKAFNGYLADKKEWGNYDATILVEKFPSGAHILIDQGLSDEFLNNQLEPLIFKKACEKSKQKLTLRMQEGYDHSYYFIASFIDDHLNWHHNEIQI